MPYDLLAALDSNPIALLDGAVAVAESGRTEEALGTIESLAGGKLDGYRYLHIARGELLGRLGRRSEAAKAYGKGARAVAERGGPQFRGRQAGAAGQSSPEWIR